MSPQILMEQPFSSKCDIWSLGMMFYEMLYGKTPWTGKNPFLLYQNITKDPLEFPDYPPRSELVKDMLKKMLVIEDSDRMSWSELFNHSLIKLDAEDIQKQLDLINQNKNIDPLLKSVEANNFYLKTNKVVGIDKTQQNQAFGGKQVQEEQKQDEEMESPDNDSKDNKQVEYNQTQQVLNMGNVIEKQQSETAKKNQAMKIDAYLTYERNLGIFVNLTTNFIFKQYKESLYSIQEHLFYRIIFILQKYQLIRFQNLLDIMGGKTQLEICSLDHFSYYQKTKEYQQTLQLIQNDNGFIKPYFKEIFGRTVNFLKQQPNSQQFTSFFSVLNDNLSKDDPKFEQVFQETLNNFLMIVRDQDLSNPKNKKKRRDILQTLKYVLVCQNLNKQFSWKGEDNSDFHEFYDKYDNINEQELEQEVMKELNQ